MSRVPRRSFLASTATAGVLGLAGCAGAPEHPRTAGRIDPIGHERPSNPPFYTFGHVTTDGEWGVIGSFPEDTESTASTLVDLSSLAEPVVVHELESANEVTRTNDVRFDPLREGLYYRSQEPDDDDGLTGIEVVDFGFEEGTPEEPVVLAQLETPPPGVHKLTPHTDEPLLYLVDMHPGSDVGIRVVDVGEPDAPDVVDEIGPFGGCHDVEYDPAREVLHAAFIAGPAEGYVIYDASAPADLRLLGQFQYAGEPEYTDIGTPGFEMCHQAHPDPERDLAIIGDELRTGVPGGKHVFDIGWGDGSLEEPIPIGFTHSPDAREMADSGEDFWWTTHFHDVVYADDVPLLVDGGYRQGAWVCNLEDPRNPIPTERYATTDRSIENPPAELFAWGAVYNDARDFAFVSDSYNGAFTFEVSAEDARGDGHGLDSHYDADALVPPKQSN